MPNERRDIVLIHGQWVTPRSWDHFRAFYEERGHRVFAPAWPHLNGEVEEIRRNPSMLAGLGISEIVDHYDAFVRTLDEPPILIGHSAGGLVVQMLLDRGLGVAGVAIDSVAPKGVFRLPFSVIKAARPVLSNPLNYWRTVTLTFKQFYYAFANTMSESEARDAYMHIHIAGPGRVIFQLATANLNPWAVAKVNYRNDTRAPLLLIAGTEDHLAAASQNLSNYRKQTLSAAVTEYKEFPHRCHLIIEQDGWQEVAGYALSWARGRYVNHGHVNHDRHAMQPAAV